MASFIDALRAGESIAEVGVRQYDRAQAWQEKLRERGKAEAASTADIKRKVAQQEFENKETVSKRRREEDKALDVQEEMRAKEKHLDIQDKLLEAETEAVKSGRGKSGTGRSVPADLAQANKNLDNARKAVSAYTVGGKDAPEDAQAGYYAALADVDRLSRGLGLNPAARSAMPAAAPAHPATHWWNNIFGGSSPDVSSDDLSQFETK